MSKNKRAPQLLDWEIAIIKAMCDRGELNNQEILAHFTRPNRTINPARIHEIKIGQSHKSKRTASENELEKFLETWPNIDHETGLSLYDNEFLIKAREAMIAAVHTFNGAGLTFRAELFIVTAIIAWTYLLLAKLSQENIEIRRMENGEPKKTKNGAELHLGLLECIEKPCIDLDRGIKDNLKILIEIRDEIEHRSTNRIDNELSSKLQACCINFNNTIKRWFGDQFGLEHRLPIALQFVTFDADQNAEIKKGKNLPNHLNIAIKNFENNLTDDQIKDPSYKYHVALIPIARQRESSSDACFKFVKGELTDEAEVEKIFFKEVEKSRYTSTDIVNIMKKRGYKKFSIYHHTKLWQKLDAKNKKYGFGRIGDYKAHWVWNDSWLKKVEVHCEQSRNQYC